MKKEKVINDLIEKHNLKSYLEIGSQSFYSFGEVDCDKKVAVDPNATKGHTKLVPVTSDKFFESNEDKFDIVFIDGLHESGQVERDIVNAMRCINKGGFIVLHDCYPHKFEHQQVPRISRIWNGDVWRAFVGFRKKYPNIKSYCYPFDYGVGVIEYSGDDIETGFSTDIDYDFFKENADDLLNLVPNETAVYTVITNNYDTLKRPKFINRGYDYICFTDNEDLTSDVWEMRYIDKSDNPALQQRKIKILSHEYLSEYKRTIYVDGKVEIKDRLSSTFCDYDFLTIKHPKRDCILDEAEAILKAGKDSEDIIYKQLESYKGFEKNLGLYDTCFLVRHNCDRVNKICEDWYKEVEKYSIRDQMSLPVVLKKHNFIPDTINMNAIKDYIQIHKHNNDEMNIHYINSGRGDKNIGKAYNDTIKHLPNDDWICITDQDCLWFPEFTCKQIEDVIKEHGNDYQIFGAYTNRIASEHQRPFPKKFDNLDIFEFREDAEKLYNENYAKVHETHAVAGFLMLFKKQVWNEIGFREKVINADTLFSKDAKRAGFNIAIMEGVYLYHWYRAQSDKPETYTKHLS